MPLPSRRRPAAATAPLLLAAFFLATAPATAATPVLEATLDNGLRVLLLEDHRSPIVSVQVWYRVGSRNERPGATGLAHFLEHMMLKGTPPPGKGGFLPPRRAERGPGKWVPEPGRDLVLRRYRRRQGGPGAVARGGSDAK